MVHTKETNKQKRQLRGDQTAGTVGKESHRSRNTKKKRKKTRKSKERLSISKVLSAGRVSLGNDARPRCTQTSITRQTKTTPLPVLLLQLYYQCK
jgi:hypothetical protein